MEREELLSKFDKINVSFLMSINDVQTRREIIASYDMMINKLMQDSLDRGGLFYSLKKRFVDVTTDEEIDRGMINIQVELINDKVITIEEYCDLVTNKEKYLDLLRWGIENFLNKHYK